MRRPLLSGAPRLRRDLAIFGVSGGVGVADLTPAFYRSADIADLAEKTSLRSDDYSSFQRGGFWVTIIATPFTTAEQANAWCDAYGFSPDDCFAKRLSHDEGPQGNTVPRR